MGDCINNLRFIHKMEYNAGFQRNELHLYTQGVENVYDLFLHEKRSKLYNSMSNMILFLLKLYLYSYIGIKSIWKNAPKYAGKRGYFWEGRLEDRKNFSIKTCLKILHMLF
jgi:hypothetical protein